MWSVSSNDQDLILVLGPEPALRWKLFCKQIIGVAQTYQAQSLISLGALLADVPHRHPTQVLGTAVDQDMIDAHDLQRSRYEGPTGIVGVLNDSAQRAGLSTASLWAAVPAYAAQLPSPKAAAALIDRLAEIVGCDAPTAVLDEQYDEYEAAIDQIIENDPSMASYLERLENMDDEDDYEEDEYSYDESDDDDDTTPSDQSADVVGGPITEESLDSEAFLEEVEQFLRSQHDD
jgi:proteasome assembly chaperone (PAC2) family protein